MRTALFAAISRRCFYGWTVLAVAGLGIFASGAGQSHIFSVFSGPIGGDLGLSKAAIGSAYGLATLVAALCLPYMGRLLDRFGPRRTIAVVVLLFGAACLALGGAANIVWLAAGFAALRCLGMGALMLACTNLVSQWFSRRRGLALSLMALGFAASMAIHPPLGQYLAETLGWRRAWVILGLLTWVLLLPPIVLLVHDRPEDKGLRPDGDPPEPAVAGADSPATTAPNGLTLRAALGTPAFYIVGAGFFTTTMMATTLHFYQVSILGAQGVAAEIAARVFPVSALTMVLAMPFVGRLFDRWRTRHVFAGGLLVSAGALVGVTLVHDVATAVLYGMLFGINNASTMTMFGYMWPRYFGRRHLGSIQGMGQMIGALGAALGPLPVGLAFDLTGSAAATLRLLALLPIACAVAASFLRTPRGVTGGEHLE
ncbi:MAG: MFS transporter [Candidatus Rokubacteria bacterium]|nr:MFS transporter [Candidatus Rokubacteria bacterium]